MISHLCNKFNIYWEFFVYSAKEDSIAILFSLFSKMLAIAVWIHKCKRLFVVGVCLYQAVWHQTGN